MPTLPRRTTKLPHPVNIHDAKTHFSRLLAKVERGGQVTIARAGRPVARLMPMEDALPAPKRILGLDRGLFTVPEDFDTPMTEEEFFAS